MADQKTNAVQKKVTKPTRIKSVEQAVSMLVGAGIKVDAKKRTQTWVWGRQFSKRVLEAAAFLDSYKVEANEQFATVWLTEQQLADQTRSKE